MANETSLSEKEVLEKEIWKLLEEVPDPEIPPLSVVDLGIITRVEVLGPESLRITMTPTFAGCPAIQMMRENIEGKIREKLDGFQVEVVVDYVTRWDSNRITDKGRDILKNFRLAPPPKYQGDLDVSTMQHARCPHCGSENTTMNTPFGPTLCRSIHYCFDCLQSFEQFKPV